MTLTFYAPVFFVKDIELSKDFYIHMLEQEIEHDFGTNITFRSKVSLWEINPDSEIYTVKGSSFDGNTFESCERIGFAELVNSVPRSLLWG